MLVDYKEDNLLALLFEIINGIQMIFVFDEHVQVENHLQNDLKGRHDELLEVLRCSNDLL